MQWKKDYLRENEELKNILLIYSYIYYSKYITVVIPLRLATHNWHREMKNAYVYYII